MPHPSRVPDESANFISSAAGQFDVIARLVAVECEEGKKMENPARHLLTSELRRAGFVTD